MSEGVKVRIPDIFRLNDWPIRRFIISVISILIAYNATFLTNRFLFEIPILPQLLGFVLLTFILGFIILRILKVHEINRTQNFLLAVGMSLSFIFIYGAFLNALLPQLGVLTPMTSQVLFFAFNLGILALLLISYFRDKAFKPSQQSFNIDLSPVMLSLLLLPLLSIFGAYVMTFYDSNILILILLFLISLIPILVLFNKIPEKFYPLTIFVVSLSILYHVNLISTHIWSFDIFYHYYAASWVVEKGEWGINQEFGMFSLLLMTVLAPTYSLLCNLNLVWVFKIIFPFLFALVPVVLYHVYQRLDFGQFKIDPKLALFSVFVYIFYYGFFKDMPDKQHIVQLFLALILMLMVINIPKRVPIAIIFCFPFITSHYGVSYVFMLSSIFAVFLSYMWRNKEKSILTANFVLLFSIIVISWYIYVAHGTIFQTVTHIGYRIVSEISAILVPDLRSGITYLMREMPFPTILWEIHKFIHIILISFIGVGMLSLWISILKKRIKDLSISFLSTAFFLLLIFQITVTFGMGMDRVLQITLVLLSSFAVIGCLALFNLITKMRKDLSPIAAAQQKFFAIFLLFFFLFSSGFVFYVAGDTIPPYSIALNKNTGWPVYTQSEVSGTLWLRDHRGDHNIAVINPWHVIKSKEGLLAAGFFSPNELIGITFDTTSLADSTYILLIEMSIKKVNDTPLYSDVLSKSNKIFDNGGTLRIWQR